MARERRPRTILRAFRVINAVVIVLATGTGGFVLGGLQAVRAVLPKEADLTKYRPLGTTFIYSTERHKDGTPTHTLLARIAKEDREPVPLHKMPLRLRQATAQPSLSQKSRHKRGPCECLHPCRLHSP